MDELPDNRLRSGRPSFRALRFVLGALLLGLLAVVVATPVLAAPPPTNHPVDGREACTTCHKAGAGGPTGAPADHSAYPDAACLGCHPVGGAAQPEPAKPTAQPATAPAQPAAATPGAPTQAPAPSGTPTPIPGTEMERPVSVGVDTCLVCHKSPNLAARLPSGETLGVYIDGEKMAGSVHGEKLKCVDCHSGMTTFPHQKTDAKTLRDFRVAQYESCKRCHVNVYNTYVESVHGRALKLENNRDVPLCGDCHGTHAVKDTDSPSYRLDSPKNCANCHANDAIMGKYGLSPDVFDTYSQDFHGATVMLYQKEAMPHQVSEAVCYDCHGVHDVKSLKSGDPVQVRQAVLSACQKCHPSAGESFPQAWLGHYELSLEKAPLAWLVRAWYLAFIPFMVGGMAIHIGADLYRSRRRK